MQKIFCYNIEACFSTAKFFEPFDPWGKDEVQLTIEDPKLFPNLNNGFMKFTTGFRYNVELSPTNVKKLPPPYKSMCMSEFPKASLLTALGVKIKKHAAVFLLFRA